MLDHELFHWEWQCNTGATWQGVLTSHTEEQAPHVLAERVEKPHTVMPPGTKRRRHLQDWNPV